MQSCCCAHDRAAGRLFSRLARLSRRRYRRRGLEPSQRQLMIGLTAAGYRNASVLEIGCGVGYLHQTLLQFGAARALGIDLSEKMLSEARQMAADKGVLDRTSYRQGDFVELAKEVEAADITLLDKVICCYPDAQTLLARSLSRTRKVYALTYPRDRFWIKGAVRVENAFLSLIGSDFRNYVYDPHFIQATIEDAGFGKLHEATSGPWLSQVYVAGRAAPKRPLRMRE